MCLVILGQSKWCDLPSCLTVENPCLLVTESGMRLRGAILCGKGLLLAAYVQLATFSGIVITLADLNACSSGKREGGGEGL